MNRRPTLPGRLRGVSLVELMVGLTLSLFILGALAQAFAYASEARRSQEASARLMDGGRAAAEIIGRTLRMASYWGCVGVDDKDLTIHADGSPPANASSDYINGYATRGLYGIDATATNSAELITWQALDNVTTTLAAPITLAPADPNDPGTREPLTPASTAGFAAGDWVSLSNCQTGEVFKLQGVASGDITYATTCRTCARVYTAPATLSRIQRNRFYVATGARGRPSLFLERDGAQPGQELVEGVEAMTIGYGFDDNLDALVDFKADGVTLDYRSAAEVTARCSATDANCWSRVASVRIALLMSTVEDGVLDQAQTYTFNGVTVTAADRRLRRELVYVISVRNSRT